MSDERMVQFDKDSRSVYVITKKEGDAHLNFEVHHVVSWPDGEMEDCPIEELEFEMYGCTGSGDNVKGVENACPQIDGFIKWDGCSHFYFGQKDSPDGEKDGYLHVCGTDCFDQLIRNIAFLKAVCVEFFGEDDTS